MVWIARANRSWYDQKPLSSKRKWFPEPNKSARPDRALFLGGLLACNICRAVRFVRSTSRLSHRVDAPSTATAGLFHRERIVDENGKPLDNVLVELLREGGGDDTGPRLEMTKSGRYSFNVRPGAYRLALNCHGCLDAPTAEHPFQTSFYPGVEQEVEAARIVVMAQKPIHLNPWHVHRLPVTAIPAQANWLNGTAAEVSSLVVDNLDYPGAIVESIPSGRGGKGPILLPVGFNYRARASVVCDDGKKLSFHESRPLLEFTVRPGLTPKTLKFVIPELPCKAWHPK